MSSSVPYWLSLVVLVIGGLGFYKLFQNGDEPGPEVRVVTLEMSPEEKAALAEQTADEQNFTGPPLTEFTLTKANGEPIDSKSLAGSVWVGSFFYVDCPSACFRLNQAIAGLHKNPAFADVKFVSITCDPENDTLDRLTAYAHRFDADPSRWFFCRGDMQYVKRIGFDIFKVGIAPRTHANYGIIIDRAGEVRGRFALTDEKQLAMAAALIAQCLAEQGPATSDAQAAVDEKESPAS